MHAVPVRPPIAALVALALLVALATGGCGAGAAAPTAPAPIPAAPPTTGAVARPGSAAAVATTDPRDADRLDQLAVAGTVLRALGDLAAGRPAPAGLRPEVLEDLRRLIDGSDGVGRRCLVEFTVVGTPIWQFSPVAFVPLLNLDGSATGDARDEGVRLTTMRLEGYRSAVTFRPPPATGATPVAPPTGSPCAPATPGVPVQLPDDTHRALRGEGLAVLVEWRDGAWVATGVDAVGVGLP